MKYRITTFVIIAAFAITLTGCGGMVGKINRLSISMHKEQVRSLFGNNFIARASKVDANGNVLDLWEFTDSKTKVTYQIFFLNDKVSQWGKREDLKAFPELHAPTYNN